MCPKICHLPEMLRLMTSPMTEHSFHVYPPAAAVAVVTSELKDCSVLRYIGQRPTTVASARNSASALHAISLAVAAAAACFTEVLRSAIAIPLTWRLDAQAAV